MTENIKSNIPFNKQINTDDKVLVSFATNIPEHSHFTRVGGQERVAHNGGDLVRHPTIDGLVRSGENHIMTAGTVYLTWEVEPTVTEQQIQNFIDYLEADAEGIEVVRDDRLIRATWETRYDQTTFRELKAKWVIPATRGSMMFAEGSELLCFLRIDGEPEEWSVEYRDITDSATIDKGGETCYVIFNTRVMVGDKQLQRGKAYKLTSGSIDVTVSENTKVVRLSRD